jgi:hypothetical protein
MDFHVSSPPSNQTQYMDIGVQLGAGFEYQVWKTCKVGLWTAVSIWTVTRRIQ